MRSGRNLWIRAQIARPLLQDDDMSAMRTPSYPSVIRRDHESNLLDLIIDTVLKHYLLFQNIVHIYKHIKMVKVYRATESRKKDKDANKQRFLPNQSKTMVLF